MATPWLTATDGGVLVDLYVAPRASRSQVVGEHDERLKVQIAAPPVEGEANKELVKLLSKALGVSKRDVEIVSGDTGRRKRVLVLGVDVATARAALSGG